MESNNNNTILDVIKEHNCICWYPSAGADFRPLIYFNQFHYEDIKIPIDEGQVFPDLFILTDVQLTKSVWNRSRQEMWPTYLSYLDKKDGLERIHTLYRDRRTEIAVNKCRELKALDIGCEPKGLAEEYEVSELYRRVFCFDVTVKSNFFYSGVKNEWDVTVLYVFAENREFARDVLMKNKVHVDYIPVACYGEGGGGAELMPDWLPEILGYLQCKYYVSNYQYIDHYINNEPEDMKYFSEYELPQCELKPYYGVPGEYWSNRGVVIWNRVEKSNKGSSHNKRNYNLDNIKIFKFEPPHN